MGVRIKQGSRYLSQFIQRGSRGRTRLLIGIDSRKIPLAIFYESSNRWSNLANEIQAWLLRATGRKIDIALEDLDNSSFGESSRNHSVH